jgi:hypothetical protein
MKNTTKLFEHENFTIHVVNYDLKIKTLTKPFFEKTPYEICAPEKEIEDFVEKNKKLLEILGEDRWIHFFFDRGDGKIFIKRFSPSQFRNETDIRPGHISVHQMSFKGNFVKKNTILFIKK